jgi:hypothetical protein
MQSEYTTDTIRPRGGFFRPAPALSACGLPQRSLRGTENRERTYKKRYAPCIRKFFFRPISFEGSPRIRANAGYNSDADNDRGIAYLEYIKSRKKVDRIDMIYRIK